MLLLFYNTNSFLASMGVLYLVINGFFLPSKFYIRVLTYGISISVVYLSLTYFQASSLVTSHAIFARLFSSTKILIYIWIGELLIVDVVYNNSPTRLDG